MCINSLLPLTNFRFIYREIHISTSKLAGNTATTLTENELDLLEDQAAISTSHQTRDHSINRNYQPQTVPRPNTTKAENVYLWDCGRLFCVSNISTMNKVIRILLIFFQVLMFMFSGTILGIGIWLIVDPKSYEPSRHLETYNVIHAAYIMIIIGGFTMCLTFFGIFTTVLQNVYMIITYLVFLLICFGMQVAIVTLAINKGYGTRLYIFAYKEFLRELQQYNYEQESRKFVDFFQIKLRCCGVESFNDYPRYGMAIPVSCYMAGHTYLNEKGCALALRQFMELRTAVVGFLSFFDAIVHLIIIVLLFMLLCVKKY
ncbi:Tetraspanin-8 [Blomia tropicalis]|nr:Tetraspanin-8 [Blomia tropicalis]